MAQRANPQARIVYADNDPIVLAHARALLTSTPEGACAYLDADLRDTPRILREAAATLDFSAPVALLLMGVLHCIPDDQDPASLVARLLAAVPSGSYLVVAHPASDVRPAQVGTAATRLNEVMAGGVTLRSRKAVARFFTGLDLVPPGLVQLHRWRPGPAGPDPAHDLANYGAVARKP